MSTRTNAARAAAVTAAVTAEPRTGAATAPGPPRHAKPSAASVEQSDAGVQPTRLAAEYVLPLRWANRRDAAADANELAEYLRPLSAHLDITVVDGSRAAVFATHHALWGDVVRHVAPDDPPTGNGKVAGVLTGIRLARHRAVILADDDVRYDRSSLERMVAELESADVVRPQNYFTALPWHARWDTARTLINRAVASDYPGTLGVNRDLLLDLGGYDGDVLFENLELIRTITAGGGRERRVDDLFVGRTPPSVAHFTRQRLRQAYDSFAQPVRLVLELGLLPLLVWSIRRPRRLACITAAAIGLAELGRRRHGGTRVFPVTSALWAPAWLVERAVCAWLAVGARMLGGAKYGGSRLKKAANSPAALRQKLGTHA